MEAHDAAHANVEGAASQQAHVILAVHKHATEQKVSVSIPSSTSKKMKREWRAAVLRPRQLVGQRAWNSWIG